MYEVNIMFCFVFNVVLQGHHRHMLPSSNQVPSEPLGIDITPKWWIEYLPVKLSVGILPLPLPRRVEIEARGVGYWIFRGSSGHFDHSTILTSTSTIPTSYQLFYLRWGAQGMDISKICIRITSQLHFTSILKQTGEKIKFRHPGLEAWLGPGPAATVVQTDWEWSICVN